MQDLLNFNTAARQLFPYPRFEVSREADLILLRGITQAGKGTAIYGKNKDPETGEARNGATYLSASKTEEVGMFTDSRYCLRKHDGRRHMFVLEPHPQFPRVNRAEKLRLDEPVITVTRKMAIRKKKDEASESNTKESAVRDDGMIEIDGELVQRLHGRKREAQELKAAQEEYDALAGNRSSAKGYAARKRLAEAKRAYLEEAKSLGGKQMTAQPKRQQTAEKPARRQTSRRTDTDTLDAILGEMRSLNSKMEGISDLRDLVVRTAKAVEAQNRKMGKLTSTVVERAGESDSHPTQQ